MAINFLDLKKSLSTIIRTITNLPFIWSDQNAPTPSGAHLFGKITTIRRIGSTDYESPPDENEVAISQGDRELVLSLMAISKDAMEILTTLDDKMLSAVYQDILTNNNIVYVTLESSPIDITTTIEGSFETRANAEFLFRISKNYGNINEVTIPAIQSVGMIGEFPAHPNTNIDIIINEEQH